MTHKPPADAFGISLLSCKPAPFKSFQKLADFRIASLCFSDALSVRVVGGEFGDVDLSLDHGSQNHQIIVIAWITGWFVSVFRP